MFTDLDIAKAYTSDMLRKRIVEDEHILFNDTFDEEDNGDWALMNASTGPSIAKALKIYKY